MSKEEKEGKYSDAEVIDVASTAITEASDEDIKESMDRMSVFSELNITDKTASLWQYKPVSENEPEAFDEYYSSEEDIEGGRITAARARGKKHKHDGTNCDDWFEYDVNGDWKILIASDGAGSRKFSRIGAKSACRAAAAYLRENLDNASEEDKAKLSLPLDDGGFMEGCSVFANILQDSVIKAKEAVEAAFDERKTQFRYLDLVERDLEIKDFACTFLVCIVLPVKVGEGTEYFAAAIQIGDGIICSVDRNSPFDKALRLLSVPDSGEYSGETDFITSDNQTKKESLMGKTKIMRGKSSAFMLMTDGVADDYFPNSPELLRLYLDLGLNSIINTDDSASEGEVPEIIPDPLVHPWVNDNDKKVMCQYAKRLEERAGVTLEELWKNTAFIKKAALENFEADLPENRNERLLRWLDNYTERGSFDDRTLVLLELDQE